jgi:hypothetical protein
MSSIRTNLRSALKSCVLEMTVAAGYNYTYRRVFDPIRNMEKMTEYPSVNILLGQERRLGDRYIGNNPILDILLPVQFDVFLHDMNDTSLAQDKAIADFQKYFGINYYIKPQSSSRTAFNCIWLSSTIWGTEVEVPNCGVTIDFEVFYSIRLTDPNVMV